MKVIHIVHGKANPEGHNGISRVVYHLNKQEKLLGLDSQIWAVVDDAKTHYTHPRDEHVTVECFPRARLPIGRHEIIERLIAQKDSIDIVHFHMIWFFDKNVIAKALKKAGIPFVITTHGTYTAPHAYTGKRKFARVLYELDYLNMATEVHVLTREEGTGLQKYGYKGNSFVVPNGVAFDEIPTERPTNVFDAKPYRDMIKAIWVGVLRDDKNLRTLIRSVAMLPQWIRDQLVVVMVGPDYRGNKAKYEALATSLGVRDNFDFVGPKYEQEKFDALESADFFIMPSFTEGMSLAVLDALACAKPGVMTMGCGMNYYLDQDFFVPCEPYAQDIARGIEALLARREDWQAMGDRAHALCLDRFNWTSIAGEMAQHYKRIADQSQ
jgi:glycosyltransferase involved in cell wall biosynthesis